MDIYVSYNHKFALNKETTFMVWSVPTKNMGNITYYTVH